MCHRRGHTESSTRSWYYGRAIRKMDRDGDGSVCRPPAVPWVSEHEISVTGSRSQTFLTGADDPVTSTERGSAKRGN